MDYCPYCRKWSYQGATCKQVTCRACGREQCFSYGAVRGTCYHCHYGELPGWHVKETDRVCGYAGCGKEAVYHSLPGQRPNTCKEHGDAILERRKKRAEAKRARYS